MYFDILKEDKIPLEDFAAKLFDETEEQKIIPFLGAGVSLSARPSKPSGVLPGFLLSRYRPPVPVALC
ncbi:MAG: hypothetical protein D8M57_04260 [Candidatus Scalindua sp. AMX11]|nr:MAG: hypothetical protein DWQ00_02175 [Candidatus Scalindua sp.]NOG84667.1 hypothetical protein [Planctomycetota bacterium]RZV92438.1 MAG: hypothetical protein EX341_05170 [Candidatus Scalindua sp. SCAELEC01]TDE66033.1 MAG: hypothetical protein D8M57_04260 [Candidatus Scalindua sp. AMX11]GJQ59004.1 MAG: hypothetical protein SCALA701_18050 [Candidatus Scalindua sp.]